MDYCCDNKCFLEPCSQVDGLACSRCYRFCYCACNCILVKEKIDKLTELILNKAKEIKSDIIGIKIDKWIGTVVSNCKLMEEEDYYSTCDKNILYLYKNTNYIPEFRTYKPLLPLVKITDKSEIFTVSL